MSLAEWERELLLEANDYDPAEWTPDTPERMAELAEITEAFWPLQIEALAHIDAHIDNVCDECL